MLILKSRNAEIDIIIGSFSLMGNSFQILLHISFDYVPCNSFLFWGGFHTNFKDVIILYSIITLY
jgi:hypothetical protein